jgi:hypothetical protein
VQGADVRHNVGAAEEHPAPSPSHEGSTRVSGA